MTQLRKERGLSLEAVAKVVGTNQANLWRIERGEQVPKRELARALHKFFGGRIPIGAIYDPEFVARAG